MEHPLISSLSDKKFEELQESITSLMNKLNFAYRTQNGPMIHQLTLILESYKAEYNKKMDEIVKKQNIQGKINIQKES
jgi:uncharacterized protein YgiM (DUF1202 family)